MTSATRGRSLDIPRTNASVQAQSTPIFSHNFIANLVKSLADLKETTASLQKDIAESTMKRAEKQDHISTLQTTLSSLRPLLALREKEAEARGKAHASKRHLEVATRNWEKAATEKQKRQYPSQQLSQIRTQLVSKVTSTNQTLERQRQELLSMAVRRNGYVAHEYETKGVALEEREQKGIFGVMQGIQASLLDEEEPMQVEAGKCSRIIDSHQAKLESMEAALELEPLERLHEICRKMSFLLDVDRLRQAEKEVQDIYETSIMHVLDQYDEIRNDSVLA